MTVPPDIIVQVDAQVVPINIFALGNTWSGINTFSAGFHTPQLPNLTTSVVGTGFPGMEGVNWFLWNAPALLSTPGLDSAPTLRVDRRPSGTGGTTGNTVAAIQALTIVPVGDKYSEWSILAQLNNYATTGAGTQCVAFAAFATKEGTSGVSPTFGGNISVSDNTGEGDPTFGAVGLEIDCGCGPTNNINGGTDVHGQRVIAYLGAGGAAGTHISTGLRIAQTSGVIIDRGISLTNGGLGYVVGLDFAAGSFSSAPIFMAAQQKLVFDGSWSGQTPSANRWLSYNGGGALIYTTELGDVLQVADAGSLLAGSTNTGAANAITSLNSGTSTSSSTYAVVKAALDVNTKFLQMYMVGGSPPQGWISSSHSIAINAATYLQFQSSSVAVADYGVTNASAWTFITAVTIIGALSTNTINLGASGTLGSIIIGNASSGTITLKPVTGGLGTVTLSLPAATDTVAVLAAAQTLTNKTIAFSSNTLTGVAPLASPTFTGTVTVPAVTVSSNQVVGARVTGYTAMTGTADKASAFATSSVTLAQLAGRVMQLQADLTTHGLIGA